MKKKKSDILTPALPPNDRKTCLCFCFFSFVPEIYWHSKNLARWHIVLCKIANKMIPESVYLLSNILEAGGEGLDPKNSLCSK